MRSSRRAPSQKAWTVGLVLSVNLAMWVCHPSSLLGAAGILRLPILYTSIWRV
jgi:hypothetical protein